MLVACPFDYTSEYYGDWLIELHLGNSWAIGVERSALTGSSLLIITSSTLHVRPMTEGTGAGYRMRYSIRKRFHTSKGLGAQWNA